MRSLEVFKVMKKHSLNNRSLRGESGQIIVLFGILLVVLITFVAFAVQGSFDERTQTADYQNDDAISLLTASLLDQTLAGWQASTRGFAAAVNAQVLRAEEGIAGGPFTFDITPGMDAESVNDPFEADPVYIPSMGNRGRARYKIERLFVRVTGPPDGDGNRPLAFEVIEGKLWHRGVPTWSLANGVKVTKYLLKDSGIAGPLRDGDIRITTESVAISGPLFRCVKDFMGYNGCAEGQLFRDDDAGDSGLAHSASFGNPTSHQTVKNLFGQVKPFSRGNITGVSHAIGRWAQPTITHGPASVSGRGGTTSGSTRGVPQFAFLGSVSEAGTGTLTVDEAIVMGAIDASLDIGTCTPVWIGMDFNAYEPSFADPPGPTGDPTWSIFGPGTNAAATGFENRIAAQMLNPVNPLYSSLFLGPLSWRWLGQKFTQAQLREEICMIKMPDVYPGSLQMVSKSGADDPFDFQNENCTPDGLGAAANDLALKRVPVWEVLKLGTMAEDGVSYCGDPTADWNQPNLDAEDPSTHQAMVVGFKTMDITDAGLTQLAQADRLGLCTAAGKAVPPPIDPGMSPFRWPGANAPLFPRPWGDPSMWWFGQWDWALLGPVGWWGDPAAHLPNLHIWLTGMDPPDPSIRMHDKFCWVPEWEFWWRQTYWWLWDVCEVPMGWPPIHPGAPVPVPPSVLLDPPFLKPGGDVRDGIDCCCPLANNTYKNELRGFLMDIEGGDFALCEEAFIYLIQAFWPLYAEDTLFCQCMYDLDCAGEDQLDPLCYRFGQMNNIPPGPVGAYPGPVGPNRHPSVPTPPLIEDCTPNCYRDGCASIVGQARNLDDGPELLIRSSHDVP